VLNYNVPDPTSYTGRNLIKLDYDPAIFVELIGEDSAPDLSDDDDEATTVNQIRGWVAARVAVTLGSSKLSDLLNSGGSRGGGSGVGAGGGSGDGAGGGSGIGAGSSSGTPNLPRGGGTSPPPIENLPTSSRRRRTPTARMTRGPAAPTASGTVPAAIATAPPSPLRAVVDGIDHDQVVANLTVGKLPLSRPDDGRRDQELGRSANAGYPAHNSTSPAP
jgi:hypothetical protein